MSKPADPTAEGIMGAVEAFGTARATRAEEELASVRQELALAREDFLAVADALGIVYVADGHPVTAGPVEAVVAYCQNCGGKGSLPTLCARCVTSSGEHEHEVERRPCPRCAQARAALEVR